VNQQKFWNCVADIGNCWIWTGETDRHGYGRLRHKNRKWGAHRLAWTLANGPIPAELTVDHLCFNVLCCNPSHLRLLTHADNAANQRSARATHCTNGHEYTPDNTYLRPARGGGQRDCRACIRDRVRRYRSRKGASA
jgi:hypothetical protein